MDHCVPESVSKLLEERGHTVTRLGEAIPPDSPDPLVALTAERDNSILISHDGDFNAIAPRIPKGHRQRFRKLSRIHMNCKKPRSAERLSAALSLLEFEWAAAQTCR